MAETFIVTELGDFLDTENGLDLITENSTPPVGGDAFWVQTTIGYPMEFLGAHVDIGSGM